MTVVYVVIFCGVGVLNIRVMGIYAGLYADRWWVYIGVI